MAQDPLGRTTGQGKGLAQVFGDTYSDYWKQKADKAEEKKKELEDVLATSSAGVWDRDLGMFKPMRDDLRQYVQDNARDIINGKFDATVGWQKKKNEMMDFVSSSKASKSFYDQLIKAYNANPDKYSNLSMEDIREYAMTPGRFDQNVFLEGKFDPQESLAAMDTALSKVQYEDIGAETLAYGKDGREFLVERSAQDKKAAQAILQTQIDRDMQFSRRQAEAYWTPERKAEQLKRLQDSMGSKRKSQQLYVDKSTPSTDPTKEKLEILSNVKERTIIPFAFEKDGKISTTVNPNQVLTKDFKIPFKSGVFKGRPSANSIPIGGSYAYSQYEDDPDNPGKKKSEPTKKVYSATAGEEFDIPRVRKSLPSGSWNITDISVVSAFTSDSKGAQTGDVIAGYPIPDDYKLQPGQRSEKRAYATLENSKGQIVLVPLKDVEASLKETYKEQFLNKEAELLKMIQSGGAAYASALKDFSSTTSQSGNNNVPSQSKGTSSTFDLFKKNK